MERLRKCDTHTHTHRERERERERENAVLLSHKEE
jgi:hypothetical protein